MRFYFSQASTAWAVAHGYIRPVNAQRPARSWAPVSDVGSSRRLLSTNTSAGSNPKHAGHGGAAAPFVGAACLASRPRAPLPNGASRVEHMARSEACSRRRRAQALGGEVGRRSPAPVVWWRRRARLRGHTTFASDRRRRQSFLPAGHQERRRRSSVSRTSKDDNHRHP